MIKFICRMLLVAFCKSILLLVPKNKNLILISSWFGQKYADSSKYVFEYLLRNSNYDVFWYTRNINLYQELKGHGKPVVYGNSLRGIWTQIRAKMLISSVQQCDFNYLFYQNCIFFDLDHGLALKKVAFKIPGTDWKWVAFQKFLRVGCDYWMSASTRFCADVINECYDVEYDHIAKCNKPRTDVLFDECLKKGQNKIVDEIKKGRRAIVWMPTHRLCGKKKIDISSLVDFKKLQDLCEKGNFVFIIKKHFYHRNEIENLDAYPNIFDITNEDVDSQVILSQADALVSDYSASYIEYLILNRPVILYAFDKDEYMKNERDLYIPFEKNTAGEIVLNGDDFLKSIERISYDWDDEEFLDGRKKAQLLYFNDDVAPGQYRQYVKNIIDQMMDKTYKVDWLN